MSSSEQAPATSANDLRDAIALRIALGYQDEAKYYLDEADQAMSVIAPVLEGLRAELDAALIQREAQAEVEQWRATFGETALRDATAIIAERDALRAQLEKAVVLPFDSRNQIEQMLRDIATTGNPTGTAAQVMRLLMSWKSAAKEAL